MKNNNFKNIKFKNLKIISFYLKSLSAITIALIFLCISCELTPTVKSSSFELMLSGNDLKTKLYNGKTLNIELEKESNDTGISKNGFLEFNCYHYNAQGEKTEDYFTFTIEDQSIPLIVRDSNHSYINLTQSQLPLGLYNLTATSSVDPKFNQTITLNVSSTASELIADYLMRDIQSSINYQKDREMSAISGSIEKNTAVIFLSSSSEYDFKVSSNIDSPNLPTLDYNTEGVDEQGNLYATWTGADNSKKILKTSSSVTPRELINLYKTTGSTEGLPYFSIKLRNSNIELKCHFILQQYQNTEIIEADGERNIIKYISLLRSDLEKYYTITTKGNIAEGDLQYCLSQGSQGSGFPTDPQSGYSSKGTSYARFSQTGDRIYFSLSFDGNSKTVRIVPNLDTIYNGKNIDFYLHIRDNKGNWLGFWKILVGGIVERIQIESASQIAGSPETSQYISAKVYPETADCYVLWYLAENLDHYNTSSPSPSEKIEIRHLLHLNQTVSSPLTTTIGGNPKSYNLVMKSRKNISSDNVTEYYNSTWGYTSSLNQGEAQIGYTIGTQPGNAYLVAVVVSSLNTSTREVDSHDAYSIYTSIPVSVSTTGEITLHSVVGVPEFLTKGVNRYKIDPYTDIDNGKTGLTVPHRSVQEYPYTLENGEYGATTRTFYFPHNRVSTINVVSNGTSQSFNYTPLSSASNLFTIEKTGYSGGNSFSMVITPNWFSAYKNSQTTSGVVPPMDKDEVITEQQKMLYGEFSFFVGTGNIEWSVGDLRGKIRIVIYDNNVYDDDEHKL